MSKIVHVDDLDHYFRLINHERRLVMVDFSASWCGPCKQLFPTLEKLSQERESELLILKVDADHDKSLDEDAQLMPLFEVEGLPTLVFIKDKMMVSGNDYRIEGLDLRKLDRAVKKLL